MIKTGKKSAVLLEEPDLRVWGNHCSWEEGVPQKESPRWGVPGSVYKCATGLQRTVPRRWPQRGGEGGEGAGMQGT